MSTPAPVEIDTRLEMFVEDSLIERLEGQATLRLQQPVPREESLVTDRPWEGNMCGYMTVFRDGPTCRLYYKGWAVDLLHPESRDGELHLPHEPVIAMAVSDDGIRWQRPQLGLHEFAGSRDNNIVWRAAEPLWKGMHGFSPFADRNPAAAPEVRYRAVGAAWDSTKGLFALQSPDGVRWALTQDTPIMTGCAFDSQNLAFWDTVRGEYRAYMRDVGPDWYRGIKTATSSDFLHWTVPEWLEYPGAPAEQLYTNQVLPYSRAPHYFLGFPTRYVERPWSPSIEALPELEHRRLRAANHPRYGTALTDGLFMASRDGRRFKRWDEAFIRPGLRTEGSWAYGDCYQCWGMLETASALPGAPRELSVYAPERYWRGPATVFRRHTLRLDGFVSLHAPLGGGELVTKPISFQGNRLQLNISTSAGGSARVELLRPEGGAPIAGFTLAECHDIIGDTLAYTVQWQNGADLQQLAGEPVRLRFVLHDADLFSYQFQPGT